MTLLPLSAGAAVPGGEGLIAYSDGTGIVVAKSDGSSSQTVAATGSNPSWNGEGTKIAYEDGAVIKVLTVPNPPARGPNAPARGGRANAPAPAPAPATAGNADPNAPKETKTLEDLQTAQAALRASQPVE